MGGQPCPTSLEVVFMQDNVSVHPTEYASERISGRLRVIKQGASVFMTWIPYNVESGGRRDFTLLKSTQNVSLAEMLSIRRHTPPVGLQSIIIVLKSGLSLPPLYFHTSGVKEFLSTLRNFALLQRSCDDSSVYFVKDVSDAVKDVPNVMQSQEMEKKRIIVEEAATINGASLLDKESQVVDPKLHRSSDTSMGKHPLSPMDIGGSLDTLPRKRYRRCITDVPVMPPPTSPLLTFTTIHSRPPGMQRGKLPRKTIDLVLAAASTHVEVPPAVPHSTTAGSSITLVHCNRGPSIRKTIDLVLSPVPEPEASTHVDAVSVLPVHSFVTCGEYAVPHSSRAVLAGGLDQACSWSSGRSTDEAYSKFFKLYCNGSFKEGVALPLSWRCRLHLAELSSDRGALAWRRKEWWLGIVLSTAMVTGIPSPMISSLFTSELFIHLMVDSRLTYKALYAIKYIDKLRFFEHVNSGDICHYLKTFFSEAIQNRQKWQRIDNATAAVLVGNVQPYEQQQQHGVLHHNVVYNVLPLATKVMQSGVSQRNVHVHRGRTNHLQQNINLGRRLVSSQQNLSRVQSGVSQQQQNANHGRSDYALLNNNNNNNNNNAPPRGRAARRWVQRSAREALRQVFEERGCKEITPDETIALAARFNGDPNATQILQLFRNWAQHKRRLDRDGKGSGSQAQPHTEALSAGRSKEHTKEAQQSVMKPAKKRPALGSTSVQPESQPRSVEEKALMARQALRQAFEECGHREITQGEATALAAHLQCITSATQIMHLFSIWAQEKAQHDRLAAAESSGSGSGSHSSPPPTAYQQVVRRTWDLPEVAKQAEDGQQQPILQMKKRPFFSTVPGGGLPEPKPEPRPESEPTLIDITYQGPLPLHNSVGRMRGSVRGRGRGSRSLIITLLSSNSSLDGKITESITIWRKRRLLLADSLLVAVYCECEMPYNSDDLMVQCEICKYWFHPSCMSFTPDQVKKMEQFVCPDCSLPDWERKQLSCPGLLLDQHRLLNISSRY